MFYIVIFLLFSNWIVKNPCAWAWFLFSDVRALLTMIKSLHAVWFHVIFTMVSGLDWMRSLCFCESSKWCLLNILSFPCEGARRWYWVYRSKLGLNIGIFVLNVWIESYCKYFTQEQWCSTWSYHVLCLVDIMDPTEHLPYILQWDELCSKWWCDGSLPYLCFALFTVFVWQHCTVVPQTFWWVFVQNLQHY